MDLDAKDRKLLYWLDQRSRATNKELGRKVGLSEQGIGYKLRRLEEDGVIRRFVAFINTPALGYSHYKVLLRLQNTEPARERALVERLVKDPQIRWVATCSGGWDLNFSLLAQTSEEFVATYRAIEAEFGDLIAEKNVHLLVKSPGFTKGYLLGEKSERTLAYGAPPESAKPDALDARLLKAISQDARATLVALARRLGTTLDVVRYRLRKLEERGVISGYTAWLDHDRLGVLCASAYFSLHAMTEAAEKRMLEFARLHRNVVFLPVMVGTYDLSLELEAESHAQLDAIVREFRSRFAEHIKAFETVLVTKEHKYDFYPFAS